jgi:hypothetical protein
MDFYGLVGRNAILMILTISFALWMHAYMSMAQHLLQGNLFGF